ncbi:hypothetical protein AB0E88_06785 [Streptomyces sp. NPDC028635]|uniref:hypothetical protein n=1 Tax=Streptomyces sp. NPDC028635 TaxID=3154800 RepID=UPI0033F09FC2
MTQGQDKKRIDLSLPQVAGSAVAAVVAAKLASSFGVYGTILGAGVVSIIATCGGTVFQHFFKQTGEQLRTVTVPGRTKEQGRPPGPGEYTHGTVYRARVKSWRRPLVAAAVVFGVTMAGVTTFELVSGSSFSGGKGTTVSHAFTGRSASSPATRPPSSGPGDDGDRSPSGAPSADGGTAPSGTPSASGGTASGATPGATPTPTPGGDATGDGSPGVSGTPGASATAPTPPAPGADSRSGSAAADPTGPAAP